MILLRVENLLIHFPIAKTTNKYIQAVNGVSLLVQTGTSLGVLGESGSGKSTLIHAILRIGNNGARQTGQVFFGDIELMSLPPAALHPYRRSIQIIFQDPTASLNPRITAEESIAEGLWNFKLVTTPGEARQKVTNLMKDVGLDPSLARRYPHELSGGQKQRVTIARAIAVEPRLLICDEPTSALDVSVQAQILNLLQDLKVKFGLTLIFISHNIAAAGQIVDRIAIMYLGRIVETGSVEQIIQDPIHPYTKALISAVPVADPIVQRKKQRVVLIGDPPSQINPPPGCSFHPRCPMAKLDCCMTIPSLRRINDGHQVACHFAS